MLERHLNKLGPPAHSDKMAQRPATRTNNINNNLYLNLNTTNTLNVNLHQCSPRKSVIGRLERVSLQHQRLSDVGAAVGQQITAKIGLKLPASQERVVEQTRWLYLRYVLGKLHQNSLPLRDLNLTKSSRRRRAAALGEPPTIITNHQSEPNTATVNPDADYGLNQRRRTVRSGTVNEVDLSRILISATTSYYSLDSPAQQAPMTEEDEAAAGRKHSGNLQQETAGNQAKKYLMDTAINSEILLVIARLASQLRDMKSELYGDTIYEHIGIDKFASIQSLLDVQRTICQEMTRSEITWCRVVALFSLFGAMSLDCVRMGAPEHVGPLCDGFIEFVERDLALWISQQGGWEACLYKYRAGYHFRRLTSKLCLLGLPLFIWLLSLLAGWW